MSTTIRVDERTKRKLMRLKRDTETWNEFLERLADESGSMNAGAWKGTDKADIAREKRKEFRESFGQ